jgi:hypothetical protein
VRRAGGLEDHVTGRLEELAASLPDYVITVDQQDGIGVRHRAGI